MNYPKLQITGIAKRREHGFSEMISAHCWNHILSPYSAGYCPFRVIVSFHGFAQAQIESTR